MKTSYGLEGFLKFSLAVWGAVLFFGWTFAGYHNECLVRGYYRDNHTSGYGGGQRYEWVEYSNDFVLRQIEFHNNIYVTTFLLGLIFFIFFSYRKFKGQGQNAVKLLSLYAFLASLFWSIQIFIRCV